jgi:hypothetical protein
MTIRPQILLKLSKIDTTRRPVAGASQAGAVRKKFHGRCRSA